MQTHAWHNKLEHLSCPLRPTCFNAYQIHFLSEGSSNPVLKFRASMELRKVVLKLHLFEEHTWFAVTSVFVLAGEKCAKLGRFSRVQLGAAA